MDLQSLEAQERKYFGILSQMEQPGFFQRIGAQELL
jgi:hypothetical protein